MQSGAGQVGGGTTGGRRGREEQTGGSGTTGGGAGQGGREEQDRREEHGSEGNGHQTVGQSLQWVYHTSLAQKKLQGGQNRVKGEGQNYFKWRQSPTS